MFMINGKAISGNDWKLSWEETYREIAAEKENWDISLCTYDQDETC
jgi:hypothetical protein